jgi:CHAT domain-containing protein/tetratricopeptide (TPR) repeat protein
VEQLSEAEGLLRLVTGQFDSAIAALRVGRPAAANDLAVAHINRGQTAHDSLDLLAALELLEQASGQRPGGPDLLFNRALVLRFLHLRRLSMLAFREFLEIEKAGFWADEARQSIWQLSREKRGLSWGQIEAQLMDFSATTTPKLLMTAAHEFPHEAREFCEGRLVRKAMEKALNGEREAALTMVGRAHELGSVLADLRLDHLMKDETERLRRVLARNDQGSTLRAFEPLRLYFRGMDFYSARSHSSAVDFLTAAAQGLAEEESPLALKAELYVEIAGHYRTSGRVQSRIRRLCQRIPNRFPELAARCSWMDGIALASGSHFEAAIESYLVAARLLEKTSGPNRASILDMLLAESLDARGEVNRAWKHRAKAMSVLPYQNDVQRRYGTLVEAAQALGRNERPALALIFLEELAMLVASDYDVPYARGEVELEIVANLRRLGRKDEALIHLEKAVSVLSATEPGAMRDRLELNAWLERGWLELPEDPDRALEFFRVADDFSRQSSYSFRELPVLSAIAAAEKQRGDEAAYEKTLARTVDSLERARRETKSWAAGADSFHRSEIVFDELIAANLETQGISAVAFDWVERSRAQSLLDRWRFPAGDRAPLASLERVAAELPAKTALLEMAFAGGKLQCWIVTGGKSRHVSLALDRAQVERRVEAFLALLESGGSEHRIRHLGEVLFKEILSPLALEYESLSRVVVVADEPIRKIPFAALVDPSSGAYLVEKTAVSSAPSATLLLLATEKSGSTVFKPQPLVMGIGKIENGPYAYLAELPHALAEAQEVARIFGGRSLIDREATKSELQKWLGNANTFHYSGHGIASSRYPEDSALVLQPESPIDDGLLRIADLASLPTRNLRLVTLSACETLRGYESGREGTLSLALAFFAAGVPEVIGTKWRIDDEGSASLMRLFYRNLAAGPPAEALRQAQVAHLLSGDSRLATPANWAAFELVGW